MAIRKWHPGKLIILWAWGGIAAALGLTRFLMSEVKDSPVAHLIEIIVVLLVFLVLSSVTWHWLGDRKSDGK